MSDDKILNKEDFKYREVGGYDGDAVDHNYYTNKGGYFFSVLDRMTGFSFGRDTETALRDQEGNFWLRMGMFDIRDYLPLDVEAAANLIKNTADIHREADNEQ